jgi:uncharacterized protein YjdB
MKKATKALALVLAVLMVTIALPLTAFAGTESGTVDGDSTVSDVDIDVVVPLNLNFALDPLELSVTSGSQIKTTDYFFINKTLAPVKVALGLTATLKDGVTLVSDPATLKPYDTNVTTKQLYFGALGATGITVGDLDFDYVLGEEDGTDPVGTYNASKSALLTAFDTATSKAAIAFALDKATDSADEGTAADALAAANKGVATFQFYGKMNTYAAWAAADITIAGAYTLTALSATTYTNYTPDFLADGLNQIKVTVPLTGITVTGTGGATSVVNEETLQMIATPAPAGASNTDVTWSVDDTDIATIDADGLLTAKSVGTVTVTATSVADEDISDTLQITVTAIPVPLTGLTVAGTGGASSVAIAGHLTMLAALVPGNSTTDPTVTWSVDDTDIATIDEDTGVLTGVGLGTVTVTATSVADPDISDTATITVTYDGPGFISGTDTLTTYAGAVITSSKAARTNITIPFFFNGLTVKSLDMTSVVQNFPASNYTITGDAFVITKSVAANLFNQLGLTGVQTFRLTLSDDSTYTFSMTLTA